MSGQYYRIASASIKRSERVSQAIWIFNTFNDCRKSFFFYVIAGEFFVFRLRNNGQYATVCLSGSKRFNLSIIKDN